MRKGKNKSMPYGKKTSRQNYDSNGPGVRIKGTAAYVSDKYLSLAKDALANGDKTHAENLLQHSEHYLRQSDYNTPTNSPEIIKKPFKSGLDSSSVGNSKTVARERKSEAPTMEEEENSSSLPAFVLQEDDE